MADRGFLGDDFDEVLSDFLDESSQLIQRLNDDLLILDQRVRGTADAAPDDLLNRMFRAAHSIKGLSAMLGLTHINNLTHQVENVFDAARNDDLHFAPHSVEVVFQTIDRLAAMIDRLKETGADDQPAEDILAALVGILPAARCVDAAPQNPMPTEPGVAGSRTSAQPEGLIQSFGVDGMVTKPSSPPDWIDSQILEHLR